MPLYPSNEGFFAQLTNILDNLMEQEKDPKFQDFITRLREAFNIVETALNVKDTGYYVTQEFVNGQAFFPNPSLTSLSQQTPTYRQVYRKVINFGTLPNNTTTSVAHNITMDSNYTVTRLYGAATDPGTSFIPLPYAHTTDANNIILNADTTNINITTGIDYSGYTTTYVIIEYITH